MILNFELDEEYGVKLDELAGKEMRTRRNLVTKIVKDYLDMMASDALEAQPEEVAS